MSSLSFHLSENVLISSSFLRREGKSQVAVASSVKTGRRREEGRRNLMWCPGQPFLDGKLDVGD